MYFLSTEIKYYSSLQLFGFDCHVTLVFMFLKKLQILIPCRSKQ